MKLKNLLLISCFFLFKYSNTSGATITTGAISPSSLCAGAAVSVPYSVTGVFNAGNIFTAQLSNAGGSFASPTDIGTLTSTVSDTISATIPSNTPAGSGYRIRVVSSNPVVTGTDNGSNLTVNVPTTSVTTVSDSDSYTWNGTTYTVTGSYIYHTMNAAGCDSAATLNLALHYRHAHVTLSTDSCGVTHNVIQIRVIITNDGDTALKLNSMAVRIAISTAIISANDTITCTYAGSSDFPVIFTGANGGGKWTDSYVTASHSMNMTNSPADYSSATAISIPIGGSKILGTFSFTSAKDWTANTNVGLTWVNAAGVVLYVAGNTFTTNFSTSANRALGPLCSLSTSCAMPGAPTTGSNSPLCTGGTVSLQAAPTTGSGPFTYIWSGPNGFSSTLQSPAITSATSAATGTYSVTITNSCGSTGSSTNVTVSSNSNTSSTTGASACNSYFWNDSTYITSGQYSYLTTNHTGCDSTAILNLTINTSSSSSQGLTACQSYLWNDSTYTSSGVYTFNTTSTKGCDSMAVLHLFINQVPTISAGGSATFCSNVPLTLTSSAGPDYLWNTGATTKFINVDTTGSFTVTVGGCTSAPKNVTAVPPPVITIQPVSRQVYSDSTVQFIVITSDTGVSFQWQQNTGLVFGNITNGGQFSGATNDTLTITHCTLTQNGYKYRCIISGGACKDTSGAATLTVTSGVGFASWDNQNGFSVYPDPVESNLQLAIGSSTWLTGTNGQNGKGKLQISIYDILGQVCLQSAIVNPQSPIQMDVSTLPSGIYYISVFNDAGRWMARFVKE